MIFSNVNSINMQVFVVPCKYCVFLTFHLVFWFFLAKSTSRKTGTPELLWPIPKLSKSTRIHSDIFLCTTLQSSLLKRTCSGTYRKATMSILNIRDAEPDLFSDYLYFNPDVYSQYDPCIREFNLDKA